MQAALTNNPNFSVASQDITWCNALAGASAPCNSYEIQASLESSTGIFYWMPANEQERGVMEDCVEHYMAWPRNYVPQLPVFHWQEPVPLPHLTARDAGN